MTSYETSSISRFVQAPPSDEEARTEITNASVETLGDVARAIFNVRRPHYLTYSRKVFIPLTQLCRDVCHYCTFAKTPKRVEAPYMSLEAVLTEVRRAKSLGCNEALLTLGERPEDRYEAARKALDEMDCKTTLDYVERVAGAIYTETGLLPHVNAGNMNEDQMRRMREVSPSMGLMLESASERLCAPGMPHFGSPDKNPVVRLQTIETAGRLQVPFTTGLLIGIGETRLERIEALIALRDIHARYGHLQEIIIQNFRPKPDTLMRDAPPASTQELLWTISAARVIFGAEMKIQAPPNLSATELDTLATSGIDDWGGVSPVTPDYVNPEAPWPEIELLAECAERAGFALVERLTVYPDFVQDGERWISPNIRPGVLRLSDSGGLARPDRWVAGQGENPPAIGYKRGGGRHGVSVDPAIVRTVKRFACGEATSAEDLSTLFEARRAADLTYICEAADEMRAETVGDTVTYVINQNINYTNRCTYSCGFCAFSRSPMANAHRDRPYQMSTDQIQEIALAAAARGATEICLQGGIHASYTGETYIGILRAVRGVLPDIHLHAFTPLEVSHGAETLGLSVREYLGILKSEGLNTLPGTAAEILDDEVRAILCPDKINTQGWLDVMRDAHGLGLQSTATIMFGHVDRPIHWARHLLRLRALQAETGGFTEFVPLPFVAEAAPIFVKGDARMGPTHREAVLVHAVARIALFGLIDNIQASWVKMGPEGAAGLLSSGVNDLGGTLMNESITRAAGAQHGQEMTVENMRALIYRAGRIPRQRTTAYGTPTERTMYATESVHA